MGSKTLKDLGVGSIAFTPLAQGLLTDKYLNGTPSDSRMAQNKSLWESQLPDPTLAAIKELNEMASGRDQTLAQMAIAWVLRNEGITTALIGASKPSQIIDCAGTVNNLAFTEDELANIDRIAQDGNINLWATSSQSDNAPS